MWQDYVGIVPGVAAAIMGIVTMATQEMRRWQKATIALLAVIAIGATAFAQWWTDIAPLTASILCCPRDMLPVSIGN
jgi:hypothetical protein